VIVAAVAPDGSPEALELAGMLARAAGEPVLPVSVVPSPWVPSAARVDAEYQASLVAAARKVVPDGEVVHARSVAAGLLEVAEREDARAIVLGSYGSVANRLLHSSHVPIALAPAGFVCRSGCPVRRVTAAYGGSGEELVAIAAREASRIGAALRVAAFAVRPRAPIVAGVGAAERGVVSQWEEDIRASLGCEVVVGHGETWASAIADVSWEDGDVLVVGSSSIGPVARVFLGSRAEKIVQHSPVPVVVVPREVLGELGA
jgi:nucleotide-binding universal stress UspA family protein